MGPPAHRFGTSRRRLLGMLGALALPAVAAGGNALVAFAGRAAQEAPPPRPSLTPARVSAFLDSRYSAPASSRKG
jgi:hypothetical protein